MNALRHSDSSPSRQPKPRARCAVRSHPHRALAFEATVKLGVNVVLGVIATSALASLVPYTLAQQAKLEELQTEVAELDWQVNRLQTEFDRHFDPQQSLSVMQEQSARINPNQRQVVWVTPSGTIKREPQ